METEQNTTTSIYTLWNNVHLFTHIDVQQHFYIRWCSCCLTSTRWMSLWGWNSLPIWIYPGFSRVRAAQSLVSCVMLCLFVFLSFFIVLSFLLLFTTFIWPLYCLSFCDLLLSFCHCIVFPSAIYYFHLAIVLSFLLLFTTFAYPIGIFKLFLW